MTDPDGTAVPDLVDSTPQTRGQLCGSDRKQT